MHVRALITPALACAAFLSLSALSACTTDGEKSRERLEFKATPVPAAFHVGDTTGLWTATRTTLSATGREQTDNDYQSFHLVSSDTNVVAVAQMRFLVGRSVGSAQVTAKDDKSTLVTESSVTVTVVAKP